MNRWAGRTMMYWDEFVPFIKRNRAHWSLLRFHAPDPPRTPPDIVTIVDAHLPVRCELLKTKWGHKTDWVRDSIILNVGWLKGEVPMVASNLVGGQRPVRGVVSAIDIMLTQGVLRPSKEVEYILLKYKPERHSARNCIPLAYGIVGLQR